MEQVAPENEQLREAAPRDSALMLGALGILAYAASMMTHEALGHGGFCLAVGGHNVMLTAWGQRCEFAGVHASGIEAAGPGVQFGAGLLAWLVLHLLSPDAARLRYFFWLYMVFNLLVSSGYVVFSGVTNFGDAAVLIAGLNPHIVWRGGLVLLGSVTYFLSMRAAALELKRFAGLDEGSTRLSRLVWIPYVTAGVFACCSGALNQTMGYGTAIGLAAASSFGAGFGLLRLPDMQRAMASKGPSPTVYLSWSLAWGVAAAAAIVVFLFFIGPGLE
jgi:hypothetical protein